MYKIHEKKQQISNERNQGINKWRYSMSTNRNIQYCQDVSSSQLDLQIQLQSKSQYFVDTDKLILRFIWRHEKPRTANTIYKEKKKKKED